MLRRLLRVISSGAIAVLGSVLLGFFALSALRHVWLERERRNLQAQRRDAARADPKAAPRSQRLRRIDAASSNSTTLIGETEHKTARCRDRVVADERDSLPDAHAALECD